MFTSTTHFDRLDSSRNRENVVSFAQAGSATQSATLRQLLHGVVFGGLATLLLLWSWQLLPEGQWTNAYAGWVGVGAFSLLGVAALEASLARFVATLALTAGAFALAYFGMASLAALVTATLILAGNSIVLAPRGSVDTLRAAAWHYLLLVCTAPLFV